MQKNCICHILADLLNNSFSVSEAEFFLDKIKRVIRGTGLLRGVVVVKDALFLCPEAGSVHYQWSNTMEGAILQI